MELEEMKAAWEAMEHRLEQQNTLNFKLLREVKQTSARRALRPLQWGQWIQVALGIFFALIFAPIWVSHRGTLHLLVPPLLLHVYGLMLIIFAIRTLSLVARLDYAEPVFEMQHRLGEIKVWRARFEQPILVFPWCFLWIPLIIVVFQSLGVDLWVRAPNVVYSFVASGFVCAGAMYGIVWWVRQKGSAGMQQWLEESILGRSVRKAQSELEVIADFGRE